MFSVFPVVYLRLSFYQNVIALFGIIEYRYKHRQAAISRVFKFKFYSVSGAGSLSQG